MLKCQTHDTDLSHKWSTSYENCNNMGGLLYFICTAKANNNNTDVQQYEVPNMVFSAEQQIFDFLQLQIAAIRHNNITGVTKRIIIWEKAGAGKSIMIKSITCTLNSELGPETFFSVGISKCFSYKWFQDHFSFYFANENDRNFKELNGELAQNL